jgi:uncharacterized protein YndB with AHSA1/START domain
MTEYRFVSDWRLDAPVDTVWQAINASETWPAWWRDVHRVDVLTTGDAEGLGAVRRYTWRTALPYSFVFETRTTRVERPHLLEALATGQLVGTGRWRLTEQAGLTRVEYFWFVRTSKTWMNLLAPVARPAFGWNHAIVMRRGAQDLARHLGARLVSATSTSL